MAPFLRSRSDKNDRPLGGRYQIVDRLGAGGFGETYRAKDMHLPGQPLCVVKKLQPQVEDAESLQVARRLFDTEAEVLYQLGSHPQIPALLAHFEDKGDFYLAQELIEGHDLAKELTGTPWSAAQTVSFLKDVLSTLAFVHQRQVIHRDLKPSNLMRRDSDGRIVVIDFGAVKQVSNQTALAGSQVSHTISIGTQGYMPSEQVTGRPRFSSDVYAVGTMGIQALTGQPPHTLPATAQEEIDWHPYAPQVHPELRQILDTMVRYDFRTRYSTAQEALEALETLPEAALSGAAASVAPPPTAAPPQTAQTVAVAKPPPNSQTTVHRPAARVAESKKRPLIPLIVGIVAGAALIGVGLGRAFAPGPIADNEDAIATDTERSEEPAAAPVEPAPRPEPRPDARTEAPQTEPPEAAQEPSELAQGRTQLSPAAAQSVVGDFYSRISDGQLGAARDMLAGRQASSFSPDFFEKFTEVSVDGLRVTGQGENSVELLGRNIYVYRDGSTQHEERTFTVELVDGQPRIVESQFVRVTKSRE